jgi:tetratricopeptide (TPR) repeat protein
MRQIMAGLVALLTAVASPTWCQSDGDVIGRIQAALRNRDFASAVQMARESLKQNPRQARILAMEGVAFSSLGQEQEALAAYRAALAIEPDSLAALEGAAQIEFKSGDPAAEEHLQSIVRLRPEEPASQAMLAVIAYRKNDCPSAIDHFAKARDVIDSRPAALTEYSACLIDQNRAEEAVPLLRRVLASQPADAHSRYNLAVAQQAAGMNKDAIETLQPLIGSSTPDPDALDLAASAHDELNETAEAVALLRAALIAEPKELKYYMDFASLALRHSSWDVGLDIVNLGLKRLPRAAPLYVARGILNIQLANFDSARADFETANSLDPVQTGGAISEAMAAIQQRDPAGALQMIEAQIRLHPGDPFLEYLKALAIFKNGTVAGSAEFNEGMAAARKAAAAEHGFTSARDLLAEMALEIRHFAEAEEQSRLALKENPSDEKAVYNLIRALHGSGNDPHGELPELTRRLSDLLAKRRNNETAENRYKLYEPDAATTRQAPTGRN